MRLHENIGRACPNLLCTQQSGPQMSCSEFHWTGHWNLRGSPTLPFLILCSSFLKVKKITQKCVRYN